LLEWRRRPPDIEGRW